MPEEVKQALKVLDKYEYEGSFGIWVEFDGVERFRDCEFRLKPLKALTLEEAKNLRTIYTPYISTRGEASFLEVLYPEKYIVKAGLAYATGEEAKRHAQQWLDDAKERVEK